MDDHSSWRSPSAADHYAAHDFADFAQEFLRRNGDYQREWAEIDKHAVEASGHPDHLKEGLAGRWGLCFPLRARRQARSKPSSVVARAYA